LPPAAAEVDFPVTSPPAEPVVPPSDQAVADSPAAINSHDVLCGRGGGTNSQIGNRRFRKLVQEFQPTYLLARRKEKPLLARTIVLIIRQRGGRFLKKNDSTSELYEVGDSKAEAKTSQALREGLDVRATKSPQKSGGCAKRKKASTSSSQEEEEEETPPPSMPRLPQTPTKRHRPSDDHHHHHHPESQNTNKELFPEFFPSDLRSNSPFGTPPQQGDAGSQKPPSSVPELP